MRRRNKKKIDAKYAEKKALIAEFRAKEHEHYLAAGKARRQRAAAFALQRREEEIQEAEEAKKEAEEALKRHPFEKEMAVCDTVLSYLKSLLPKEKEAKKEEKKEIVAPEGMTLLKKEEDVYFAEAPKKGKKGRKDRKSEKKASFVHGLETLESFATIRVAAPKTADEVEKCIETVTARKEFFNGLPRGADVAAELAKQN